jgi:hypothetical protein
LWAIGRLGSLTESHLDGVLRAIEACLDHPDPQVRGMAVWCLEHVGKTEFVLNRKDLLADDGEVDLYEHATLKRTSVSELARRAAARTRPGQSVNRG